MRRYARCLLGSREIGDALADAVARREVSEVDMFRAFTEAWNGPLGIYAQHLQGVSPATDDGRDRGRQLRLLTGLEGFSCDEATAIVGGGDGGMVQAGAPEAELPQGGKLLVVARDLFFGVDLAEAVMRSGCEVTALARTSREAGELAACDPPQAVLVGMLGPEGRGNLELFDELKSWSTVPILAVAAHPEPLLAGRRRPEPVFVAEQAAMVAQLQSLVVEALALGARVPRGDTSSPDCRVAE